MHHTNYSRKTNENEIVEFHYRNFLFIITRFKRVNWKEYEGFARYQYFLYTFDKRLGINHKKSSIAYSFDILVRESVFSTFEDLMQNLDAILSEYIMVDDAIFDCLKHVEELNPIYINKE